MAIGERIHFFRLLRGMTQKYLGTIIGFPERSADVRLAQYETGTRKPKAELTAALAQALDVSPHALDVPDLSESQQGQRERRSRTTENALCLERTGGQTIF